MKTRIYIDIEGCKTCPYRTKKICRRYNRGVIGDNVIPQWCSYSSPEYDDYASKVIKAVASIFGVTVKQMESPSREHDRHYARCTVWYLLRDREGWSTPRLGALFNRDHATVLNGYKAVNNILATHDQEYYQKVVDCIALMQ